MGLTAAGFEWEVLGRVVHVLEGNLLLVDLDLGWQVYHRSRVRVLGLEVHDAPRLAHEARRRAQQLLPQGSPLIVRSIRMNRLSRSCDAYVSYGPGFEPRSDEGSFALAMIASGCGIQSPDLVAR